MINNDFANKTPEQRASSLEATRLVSVNDPRTKSSYVPSSSLFAKLLAVENIDVIVDPSAKTAGFVPKTRQLILPDWQGFETNAWFLFIAHEVGHAKFTDSDKSESLVRSLAKKHKISVKSVMGIFNVVEDIRIERLIRLQYRGLSGVFSRGYRELVAMDFFRFGGTGALTAEAFAARTLPDKLNLYGKIGALENLRLTDSTDIGFYNRAVTAETLTDVSGIVDDIIQLLIDQQQPPQDGDSKDEDDDDSEGDEGEGDDSDDSDDSEGDEGDDSDEGEGDEGEDTEGEGDDSDEGEGDGDDEGTPASGKKGGKMEIDPGLVEKALTCATQEAAEEALNQAIDTSHAATHRYILPSDLSFLNQADYTLDELLKGWHASPSQRTTLIKQVQTLRAKSSSVLASMASTFRIHQAAQTAKKIRLAKTGAIDTGRLPSYKLTEDIFLRRQFIPKGKNHGLVLNVDWSSSMHTSLPNVMWQTLNLIWFAESINIPVEVYAFTTAMDPKSSSVQIRKVRYTKGWTPVAIASMIQLYTTSASVAKRQEAQAHLLALILGWAGLSNHRGSDLEQFRRYFTIIQNPDFVDVAASWATSNDFSFLRQDYARLGGTPLYLSMLASARYVRAFRDRHQIEHCVSIWLTDGEDGNGLWSGNPATKENPYTGYLHQATILLNATGKVYDMTRPNTTPFNEITKMHRDLTGAKVVFLDLCSSWGESLGRMIGNDALLPLTKKANTFADDGIYCADRTTVPTLGADAYIVTTPKWWTQTRKAQREQARDQRENIAAEVGITVARKVSQANVANASLMSLRRFAEVLVPYIATGRD